MTPVTDAPLGCTTDATLMRDLEASKIAALIKCDFEDHNLCTHRTAERLATMCVSILDPATYDAALWKAAEALYQFMDGRHEAQELHQRDASVRALYLTMAVQAFSRARLALEGGFAPERLAEAYAHLQTHRNQLAERRHLRAVEGGRS